MSVGLFGKKLGMTQIFDESGSILPVTLLKTEACQVSQIKTTNTDGYNAIQVAYCEEKLNKITKPQLGHLKKLGDKGFSSFGEFRVNDPQQFKLGLIIVPYLDDVGGAKGLLFNVLFFEHITSK